MGSLGFVYGFGILVRFDFVSSISDGLEMTIVEALEFHCLLDLVHLPFLRFYFFPSRFSSSGILFFTVM